MRSASAMPMTLCLGASVALVALGPVAERVYAQNANVPDMNCSPAGMKKAEDSWMKMRDWTKKEDVLKELDMAQIMIDRKDDGGCRKHMEKAMGMMKKQK